VEKRWFGVHLLGMVSFSSNIIWIMASRRMRWDEHVAREVHTGLWWTIMKEGAHLEERAVDGRTIFKQSLRKENERVWIGLIWSKNGEVAGSGECSNETSGSIKRGNFY
jgi:hypothetical protein